MGQEVGEFSIMLYGKMAYFVILYQVLKFIEYLVIISKANPADLAQLVVGIKNTS